MCVSGVGGCRLRCRYQPVLAKKCHLEGEWGLPLFVADGKGRRKGQRTRIIEGASGSWKKNMQSE